MSINTVAEQRNQELHDKDEALRFEHYHVDRRMVNMEDNLKRLTTELTSFNRNQTERVTQTNLMTGPAHMQTTFKGGSGLFK